jgi:hypothetical protein
VFRGRFGRFPGRGLLYFFGFRSRHRLGCGLSAVRGRLARGFLGYFGRLLRSGIRMAVDTAQLHRDVFIDRAGVGLLFGDP